MKKLKYQPRRVYVAYDPVVDAAYVYLNKHARHERGIVKCTRRVSSDILLDFDSTGALVGIEFLGAKTYLPKRWRQRGRERTYTAR